MTMGKRVRRSGAEQDALSRFGRRYMCWVQRPGVRAGIKRQIRRRERAESKAALRTE